MASQGKPGFSSDSTEKRESGNDTPPRDVGLGECYEMTDGECHDLTDPREDRKLTTRLDIKVLPILGLLYLIVFLDRTAIGNARLQGLEKELHMPSNGFNTALWIFYIPYVLAEVPSNMMMSVKWIRPDYFLGLQCFILGILTICQGLTKSYGGLLVTRFLMGILETGLAAGGGLLVASYYRKKELSLRFALYFALGEAGACFSGLLAYAIAGMSGTAGLSAWRWIFILEGLITLVFAFFVTIFCPNFPADDKKLKPDQKRRLLARLEADRGQENSTLQKVSWKKVVFDYRVWLMTLLFFCADISAGSLSSFNPTILSQLGWTSRRAQVMTIPVWLAGIFAALAATLISGRMNKRWPFCLAGITTSMIGWTIHVTYQKPGVRYFAQFLISMGTFVQMPMYIGWLTANLRGRAAQSFGTAILLGIGNCANFVSSNVFITKQAPHYPVGFGTGLGLTAFGFPLVILAMFLFTQHNKKIDAKIATGERLDENVDYKYVL